MTNEEEDKHLQLVKERANKLAADALNMSRARFTLFHNAVAYDFKVYTQIWQDDDWDYVEQHDYVKNLAETTIELNNSTYKTMSDTLFIELATRMPGREIWIIINSGNTGLTTHYK